MGHTGEDSFPGVPPLAVAGDGPFQAEEIVLAGEGEAPPIPIPYRVRHPVFWTGDAVSGRVKRFWRALFCRGKYLPVAL